MEKTKQLQALIQHPMWLLIKEDNKCMERDPQWGAPSVEDYSKRLERNLESLERNPQARVNYDFSGTELEDIRAMFPKIAERIKAAVGRKQLQLVNGTYSQAHLHTLSLEATVRQFSYGLKVIRAYGQDGVSSYIIQEPGYTGQTPQLLRAFGFKYCAKSCFAVYQNTLDSRAVLTPDDFFCRWRGLDGSEILTISGLDWYHLDMLRKLSDGTDFRIYAPDLVELHADANRYVLLDQVLPAEERALKRKKTKFKAITQYVPWSYLEGTDGEELITLDTECETALVQMETVNALLGITPGNESEDMWKTWLTSQHHDAYWSGAPELRKKCCNRLRRTIAGAQDAVKKSLRFESSKRSELVCFSIYPKEQKGVVTVDWRGSVPAYFTNDEGAKYAVQKIAGGDESTLLVEFASKGAGYYRTLLPEGRAKRPVKEILAGDFNYRNRFYSAVFRTDGSMAGISPGVTVFPSKPCSSLGAVTALAGGVIRNFNEDILETSVQRGALADVLQVRGKIGGVPVRRTICLYHDLPWFENRLEFDFHNSVLGESYFDVNKLNLLFPLDRNCEVIHGIGGGHSVPDEPETAFFPVNWVDVESGGMGLSIVNFGTRKHWIKEDMLGITLAWGGKTAYFSNRVIDNSITTKNAREFDLRLNGRRTFKYVVYPHKGSWIDAGVPDIAMSLIRPPVVLQGVVHGDERESGDTLSVSGNVVPTSVCVRDGTLACRVYESEGRKPIYKVRINGRQVSTALTDVAGKRIRKLKPFGVCNLVPRRSRSPG